jgi:tRNA 2-thiouridine synthesizing protein E
MHISHTRSRSSDASTPPLFDEDGFIIHHELWSERLASRIAADEGIDELTEAHWRVIRHIRDKFQLLGGFPSIRQVCRATSLSSAQVHHLFGGCMSIWRIAGLPNPGEEAKAYMV